MSFKENLLYEIDSRDISKKELAAKIGISYNTFLSYINAREVQPSIDMAEKIALALNVTIDYLITGRHRWQNSSAELFLQKYERFEDILEELDQLPAESYKNAKPGILGMIRGYKKGNLEQSSK
jgi:transcriptional regulator with XRE-family HTH domain